MDINKKIDEYLNENRDKIVEDIINLCRIPSVKSEAKQKAPFGEMSAKALLCAYEYMKNGGYDTTLYADDGYALSCYGEGEKTIGIFGHCDVVSASEEEWTVVKPFNPEEKDGFIFGRGVEDDKSAIVETKHIFNILSELNIKPKNKIMLFMGSNEEDGMEDIDAFVKNQKMPDVSIVPDTAFPVSIGEKGQCITTAKCNSEFQQIVEFNGGKAFNIVLDRLSVKINADMALEEEINSLIKNRKEFEVSSEDGVLTMTVIGVAGHAADPQNTVNSVMLASKLLASCVNLCENDRRIMKFVSEILDDSFGTGLGISYTDKNFGRLTASCGLAYITDKKLFLNFDIRFGNEFSSKQISEKVLKKFADNDWIITKNEQKDAFDLGENSKAVDAILNVFREQTGENNSKPYRSGGGTYARHLKNAYSLGTSYDKDIRFPKLPSGHGGAHQADECISVDGVLKAIKILVNVILKLDEII